MADDRFDPEPSTMRAAGLDRVVDIDPDRWSPDDVAWVRARVQEALDDPRPPLSVEEVEARAQQRYARMRAKFGR